MHSFALGEECWNVCCTCRSRFSILTFQPAVVFFSSLDVFCVKILPEQRAEVHTVMEFLDQLPLWGFFAFSVLVAMLCVEAGLELGKRHQKTSAPTDNHAALNSMVGSALGLLAFLLAFTFSIAAARFEDRRQLVVQDANTIKKTYLLADFLEQPGRDSIKNTLRQYVQYRIDGLKSPQNVAPTFAKCTDLCNQMWTEAVIYGHKHPDSQFSGLFATALSEMVQVNARRETARLTARVPKSVWLSLFVVAGLSLAGVGYYCGLGSTRSWPARIMLVTSFATVMLLVADIDRPGEGTITVSQKPLEELSHEIGSPSQ